MVANCARTFLENDVKIQVFRMTFLFDSKMFILKCNISVNMRSVTTRWRQLYFTSDSSEFAENISSVHNSFKYMIPTALNLWFWRFIYPWQASCCPACSIQGSHKSLCFNFRHLYQTWDTNFCILSESSIWVQFGYEAYNGNVKMFL